MRYKIFPQNEPDGEGNGWATITYGDAEVYTDRHKKFYLVIEVTN